MEVEAPLIEVPGEANPLTEGILFHVLKSASSSDRNQVQTGTKQLQRWETERGFYPLLQVLIVCPLFEERDTNSLCVDGIRGQIIAPRSKVSGDYTA